jgi:hypothetical protein
MKCGAHTTSSSSKYPIILVCNMHHIMSGKKEIMLRIAQKGENDEVGHQHMVANSRAMVSFEQTADVIYDRSTAPRA